MAYTTRLGGLLLAILLSGCTAQFDNVYLSADGDPRLSKLDTDMRQRIDQLATALIALDPMTVDPQEATDVAHDAFVYPMHLANDWDLAWPPVWHNTLRNVKQRKAGLCVDWTRAMRAWMRQKNLQTFDLYWGIANKGNAWREHSTLVVTAKGQPFETGIVLDPWRNSGKLFWSKVTDDKYYQWHYFEGPG